MYIQNHDLFVRLVHLNLSKEGAISILNINWTRSRLELYFCERIQTKEVVRMAMMVPVGIDFDASAKSPDRFDPAIIPDKRKCI